MSGFKQAVADHNRRAEEEKARRLMNIEEERLSKEREIYFRLAPFRAADASIVALARSDKDFKKYLEESIKRHHKMRLAQTTFGKHKEDGEIRGDSVSPDQIEVVTRWYLVLAFDRTKNVHLEVKTDRGHSDALSDVPNQVWKAFLEALEILGDERYVFDFLLDRYPRK